MTSRIPGSKTPARPGKKARASNPASNPGKDSLGSVRPQAANRNKDAREGNAPVKAAVAKATMRMTKKTVSARAPSFFRVRAS